MLLSQIRGKAKRTIASTLYDLTQQRIWAGIAPLLHLSTLSPLLPIPTTLSVCTARSLAITGENLTGGLGPEINESSGKEDTSFSITGSPDKLTDGSKFSLCSRASIKIDAETSLSLSASNPLKAPTFGINP
ncbi:hypothetical protein AYI68_g7503 [Smittium mucronatum]|uniref:Uncharacterized protein n=1 Tax=Smittium mucronatum TaxID=133383 RepID=A0A1R0GNJ3_9FUNG|nr:hypothetical protein AYI68_g7503 [Smittium mucronatum]